MKSDKEKASTYPEILIKRESDQKLVEKLIKDNIEFSWNAKPQESWAGYSKSTIVLLTQQIANILGISPENAKIIEIYFADKFEYPKCSYLGMTQAEYLDGNLNSCMIVINRSKDIVNDYYLRIANCKNKPPYSFCNLESSIEWIIWVIAEELFHAKLLYMAKTQEINKQRQIRFEKIIDKKRGWSEIDYENDYQEMAVAINCLKVLSMLIPKRADYFNEVKKQAIKNQKRPIPDIKKIKDHTFV